MPKEPLVKLADVAAEAGTEGSAESPADRVVRRADAVVVEGQLGDLLMIAVDCFEQAVDVGVATLAASVPRAPSSGG